MKTTTWLRLAPIVTAAIVAIAWLALSGAAAAQTASGNPLGEGFGCFCGSDLAGANICWQDAICDDVASCDGANPCEPGFTCVVDTCCGAPVCLADCPDGTDCANPGTCGTFEECMAGMPSLPGFGPVVLGLLLVGLGSLILWRRRVSAGGA